MSVAFIAFSRIGVFRTFLRRFEPQTVPKNGARHGGNRPNASHPTVQFAATPRFQKKRWRALQPRTKSSTTSGSAISLDVCELRLDRPDLLRESLRQN